MCVNNIKATYKEIFELDGNPSADQHIKRLELQDAHLPYSSTFSCITNSKDLSFEFISNNLKTCLGYDPVTVKSVGMKYFWDRIHQDDVYPWLDALNALMTYTLKEVAVEDRCRVIYTLNFRLKNSRGRYVNIVQHTSPLELDNQGKPIIALAHYTVLPAKIKMDVCAAAKYLNIYNEYETHYFNNLSQKTLSTSLSKREREIISLLLVKKSSKEIAECLKISPNTVDTHRRNILKKLNISSTGELIGMLRNNPLIK